jgi:transposase
VAESYEDGETVCAVARRHALSPQQLFTWRRLARRSTVEMSAPATLFVPAVIGPPVTKAAGGEPTSESKRLPRPRKKKAARETGVIELEIDGIGMRVGRGADAKTVAAVIRALKATS